MATAMVVAGDTSVQLLEVAPLKDVDTFSWHLVFRDLPTGSTTTIKFGSEDAAMKALAAWIVSDEPINSEWQMRALDVFNGHEMFLFLP